MTDGVSDTAGLRHDIAVLCRELTKGYGTGDAKVIALRGIDLDIRRGETIIVASPSGCGKTTLISIIAAILEPDSGVCEVLGHDLQHLSQSEREHFRGDAVGFVFQLFNLLPALTAIENVAVPLLIKNVSRRHAEARAREVLEQLGSARA